MCSNRNEVSDRFIFILVLLFFLWLCSACGTVENARAVKQADQAMEGGQRVLARTELRKALAGIAPEAQAVIGKALGDLSILLGSARLSLGPPGLLLSGGKPVQVDTTAAEAEADPARFMQKSAVQSGRARAEAEEVLATWDMLTGAFGLITVAAGDTLGQLLGAGGIGTLLLAFLGKHVQTFIARGRAVRDAAAVADDVAKVDPADKAELARVKLHHARRQAKNGTHAIIVQALDANRPPAAPEKVPA